MAKAKKPAAPADPDSADVQTSEQHRCSVCGTVTTEESCPVDGSKMSEMEVADAG